MLVEQAVFTSTQTDRAEGYQLVAASPGMTPDDRQELSVWGPSHDSLAYSEAQASSVNFFPLSSGTFCVSKTTTCSGEYSGRVGARVYTQCLVATPDTLRRFANNPFALLRAATAQGTLRPQAVVPTALEAIRLVGRCAPVDYGLLTDLAHDPGIDWLAAAVAEMIAQPKWGLAVGGSQASRLISGLLNCLPVECRTEVSFTTGLRWSPRRPFRLVCLPPDPAEIRRAERQQGPVFNVTGQALKPAATHRGWAGYVAEVLLTGRASGLTTPLADGLQHPRLAGLDSLGEKLRQEMGTAETPVDNPTTPDTRPDLAEPVLKFPRIAEVSRRGEQPVGVADHPVRSATRKGTKPDAFEILDLLDDAVFDAIEGKSGAVEQLRSVWPLVTQQVGADVLGESKEQYIRRALATWHQQQNQQGRGEAPATQLLEVLCIVFGA